MTMPIKKSPKHPSQRPKPSYHQLESGNHSARLEYQGAQSMVLRCFETSNYSRLSVADRQRLRASRTIVLQAPTTQRLVSATEPTTAFELARNRLHVKAVPDSLPCREDEFLEIQEHLESAIEEGSGSCICKDCANPYYAKIILREYSSVVDYYL